MTTNAAGANAAGVLGNASSPASRATGGPSKAGNARSAWGRKSSGLVTLTATLETVPTLQGVFLHHHFGTCCDVTVDLSQSPIGKGGALAGIVSLYVSVFAMLGNSQPVIAQYQLFPGTNVPPQNQSGRTISIDVQLPLSQGTSNIISDPSGDKYIVQAAALVGKGWGVQTCAVSSTGGQQVPNIFFASIIHGVEV